MLGILILFIFIALICATVDTAKNGIQKMVNPPPPDVPRREATPEERAAWFPDPANGWNYDPVLSQDPLDPRPRHTLFPETWTPDPAWGWHPIFAKSLDQMDTRLPPDRRALHQRVFGRLNAERSREWNALQIPGWATVRKAFRGLDEVMATPSPRAANYNRRESNPDFPGGGNGDLTGRNGGGYFG